MNRDDFPILSRTVYNRPLVYLDNAATTQKPLCVLEAMQNEYLNANANVHRGVHYLSQKATDLHEAARETVRKFINARSVSEVIFTRGTTESVNLVASSFTEAFMKEGDEVIVSEMEHHSNIVPWQLQSIRRGVKLRVIPINNKGELMLEELDRLINERTKLISVAHVSNVLGTINDVKAIIRKAHSRGIPVMIDAAQSAPHIKIDVQDLDCDFLALSGHKMYGPTGIGVLYGKENLLERMPPYQGGGEMIGKVSFEHTTYGELPFKFEAGTPDYVATHGLATAIDYLESIGMDKIEAHEHDLTQYCMQRLSEIEGMTFFGTSEQKTGVVSFLIAQPNLGIAESRSPEVPRLNAQSSIPQTQNSKLKTQNYIHHLDLGTLLDRQGIAVRTGHHCAEPLMNRLGISGTVRASFALYNTRDEIDALFNGIRRAAMMLS